ncbi:MAG: hypothetical protein H6732_02145 [Alphaproteobacteria bacterium]|nr:hypothetical protein [Alphaproteobacteria bacterium]
MNPARPLIFALALTGCAPLPQVSKDSLADTDSGDDDYQPAPDTSTDTAQGDSGSIGKKPTDSDPKDSKDSTPPWGTGDTRTDTSADTWPDTWPDTWQDTGPPPVACTTSDPTEPNNAVLTAVKASPVADGAAWTRTAVPIDGIDDPVDRYEVNVPSGCYVDASITFDASIDLDLYLSTPIQIQYDGSYSASNPTEQVDWLNEYATAVKAYVDVESWDLGCTSYDLSIALVCTFGGTWSDPDTDADPPAPACSTTDGNEPNDRRNTATATGVSAAGNKFSATAVPLDGRTGDVDLYRADVPAGCVVEATAAFTGADADVDIELLAANGTNLDGSYGVGDTEGVAWQNTGSSSVPVYFALFNLDLVCEPVDVTLEVSCPGGSWTDPYPSSYVDTYYP